jgi:hypothetical protein
MKVDFNKALALLDKMPGQKRTVVCLYALGMLTCQLSGWHVFSLEHWSAVGAAFMVAFQLKLIREEK